MNLKAATLVPAAHGRAGAVPLPLSRRVRARPAPLFVGSASLWREQGAGAARALDFVDLFRAVPVERVARVKAGVMARDLTPIGQRMALSNERLYALLGLSRSTVDRKVREDKPLSRDEGERVLGMARLVGQAEAMVAESGDAADFDAPKWLAGWLAQPLPALADRAPGEFMDTAEGQALVAGLLGLMQSGAYA